MQSKTYLSLLSIVLFGFAMGCNKSSQGPTKRPVSAENKKQIEIVDVSSRLNATKNAHAFDLYRSLQQIQHVAGGNPAEDFTPYIDQGTRQFQNAVDEHSSGKIVGGRKVATITDPTRFQFQVALVYTRYLSTKDGQFCSGSLIAPTWVLTAAHCVKTLHEGDLVVFAGSYNLLQPGRLVPIATNGIIRNENYNNSETYPLYDVALLKLASPISDLKTIALADESAEKAHSSTSNAIISGWGDTSEGSGSGSDDLLYTRVGIMEYSACNAKYNGSITQDMVCATKANADTCQGDSGGPLIITDAQNNWYEEGIVSWGIGCAQAGFPGVYVRVPTFVSWITTHMQ